MPVIGELLSRAASSVPNPSTAQADVIAKLTALQTRLDEGRAQGCGAWPVQAGQEHASECLARDAASSLGRHSRDRHPDLRQGGRRGQGPHHLCRWQSRFRIFRGRRHPARPRTAHFRGQNPRNCLQVEKVEIEFPSDFLKRGVLAIDTPGVGSTFLHNTETAGAVLGECDAALFVLSADPPITEVEVKYLRDVQKLIPKLFFILNKVDLLDESERDPCAKVPRRRPCGTGRDFSAGADLLRLREAGCAGETGCECNAPG